jgi:hypothetical protein
VTAAAEAARGGDALASSLACLACGIAKRHSAREATCEIGRERAAGAARRRAGEALGRHHDVA